MARSRKNETSGPKKAVESQRVSRMSPLRRSRRSKSRKLKCWVGYKSSGLLTKEQNFGCSVIDICRKI